MSTVPIRSSPRSWLASLSMHFARQRLAAVGPRLPARQDLFNKLLASKAIARAVEDEARSKKISHEKAQQNAIALMGRDCGELHTR